MLRYIYTWFQLCLLLVNNVKSATLQTALQLAQVQLISLI